MTEFIVRPFDYVFFGSPAPQSAGETHFMRSLFPPPPRTFQGIVRTRLLSSREPKLDLSDYSHSAREERARLVGDADHLPDDWQVTGPVPVAWNALQQAYEPWLPTPRFLRRRGKAVVRAKGTLVRGNDLLGSGDAVEPSGAVDRWVIGTEGFEGAIVHEPWLNVDNMLWALGDRGVFDPKGVRCMPPHVMREMRSGVQIDTEKGTAKDQQLYTVEQLRFDGLGGLLGGFTGSLDSSLHAQSLQRGVVPVGRWNRLAVLQPVDEDTLFVSAWDRLLSGAHLPSEPDADQLYWMVLWTPANLSVGTRDGDRKGRAAAPELSGGQRLTYHAVCLADAQTLGGFSMTEQKVRPNRIYAAPGSAWLFSLPQASASERGRILRELHAQHVLGPKNEAQMGFGRVLIGVAATDSARNGESR